MGHSATLLERLRAVESRMDKIKIQQQQAKRGAAELSGDGLRRFAIERLRFFPELIRSDLERAKIMFTKHLPMIILSPIERNTGPVFEVSGAWKLNGLVKDPATDIQPPRPVYGSGVPWLVIHTLRRGELEQATWPRV